MEYDIDTQAAESGMITILLTAIWKQQLLIVVPLEFINYVLYEYQYFPSDVILSILSRKHKSVVLYPNLIICNLDKSSIVIQIPPAVLGAPLGSSVI